jgi:hypothetical protein
MPWFAVGDFHDNTTRLLCTVNGYDTEAKAQARIVAILAKQHKPHHVSYRHVEAASWQVLEMSGVKI